ncbi:MAG: hypothetical protein RR290_00730 [Clostridia bacterium]
MIRIQINSNVIKLIKSEYLTTGMYNQIECEFEFSKEWQELENFSTFNINNKIYKEKIINNKCNIPAEALKQAGILYVGVYGNKIINNLLEKRNTTGLLKLEVFNGYKEE